MVMMIVIHDELVFCYLVLKAITKVFLRESQGISSLDGPVFVYALHPLDILVCGSSVVSHLPRQSQALYGLVFVFVFLLVFVSVCILVCGRTLSECPTSQGSPIRLRMATSPSQNHLSLHTEHWTLLNTRHQETFW